MAGASANHETISVNVLLALGSDLKDSPCEPFGSDMKLKLNNNFFYPDVMVDCH
jgi:Uma2 family endonuclease